MIARAARLAPRRPGELHRAAGTFLASAARVVRETVDVLTHGTPPAAALPHARATGQLADASWALYQSERHPPSSLDGRPSLVAGHHAVRGAEGLLRESPTGRLLPCARPSSAWQKTSPDATTGSPTACCATTATALIRPVPAPSHRDWPTDLGRDLYHLADLHVWLDGLRDDLGRISGPGGRRTSRPPTSASGPAASPTARPS